MLVRQWWKRFALGVGGTALGAIVGFGVTPAAPAARAASRGPAITVYKNPTCGCCKKWIAHLEAAGFPVTARDTSDLEAVRMRYAVPANLTACHTALVQGYVIEGHVPADLIARLLATRPKVAGLAVPGMPPSSPGMDLPSGEHYEVVMFDRAGKTAVYATR